MRQIKSTSARQEKFPTERRHGIIQVHFEPLLTHCFRGHQAGWPSELAAVVRETVESYRPQLEANGFNLEYVVPEVPVWVNGDGDALAQIVVNLLSNAEKYSQDRKEITVELERKNEPLPHAELRVLDHGMGVPPGSEEKIFEQFYRAHDSLSSGIQGSGLGLTLARQIARAHGGDVTSQRRKPGGGSCFALRLPAISSHPDSIEPI